MQAQSKVLGPFEVIQEVGPEGRVLVTIPWAEVRGAQLIIAAEDNYGRVDPASFFLSYWAIAEVALFGSVQGYEFCIKRQAVRMLTGPLGYIADDATAYDRLVIRARNMSGGRRGPPAELAPFEPSAANGYSLKVQIHIQPRGGIGPSARFRGMG